MATVQDHTRVRVNGKGEITVPWLVFVNVHHEEVCDILKKKATTHVPHTIRPITRAEGVKQFI